MLSAFRRDSGALLDTLLTHSLTALIAEGLISLEELAIDGTKVRARAGHNSLAGREKLDRIETAVAERVATLNSELEQDAVRRRTQASGAFPAGRGRTRKADRSSAAATCRTRKRAKEEAAKSAPTVSTSDPDVRQMRMPDGATHPTWNVQVATATGFVVTIEPTDRRNPRVKPEGMRGLAVDLVAQIEQRCGEVPKRLLANATAMTVDEIASFGERCPDLRSTARRPNSAARSHLRASGTVARS